MIDTLFDAWFWILMASLAAHLCITDSHRAVRTLDVCLAVWFFGGLAALGLGGVL